MHPSLPNWVRLVVPRSGLTEYTTMHMSRSGGELANQAHRESILLRTFASQSLCCYSTRIGFG